MLDPELQKRMEERANAYTRGFEIGFEAKGIPNYMEERVELVASLAVGFTDGLEFARMKWPKMHKPEWMNEAQMGAILSLYLRGNSVLPTFPEFLQKAEDYGDYAGIAWAGMFIGVEKDGYAHS